jgi:hypothetical protein
MATARVLELVEVEFALYDTEAITRLAGPIEADSEREPEIARLFRQFFQRDHPSVYGAPLYSAITLAIV